MKRSVRWIVAIPFIFVGLFVVFMIYVFAGQEYVYAKNYANQLLEYELPERTTIIEQDFDYGVLYGGGPWGSGGRPTIVAYQRISTELSEEEIYNHYKPKNFEIYFNGLEDIQENSSGQVWYEGTMKNENLLSSQRNEKKPLEAIIQYRTEFSYPFFIDLY
ncbi:hypothetical protein [Litchfieldia salsa]|uniref:Uncharacterized protein n=1 Tax=Litchfieldia salsa TaxID=930152 RepID=A0A1H0SZF7_9BACI|nr:hypothetical protein [Litchfieldia salsa]SDP46910.1 hypothetical protein SAMN05216565_103192 [Litchfieldia salsa]